MTDWAIHTIACVGGKATPLPQLPVATLLIFPADALGEELAAATAVANDAAVLGRVSAVSQDGDDLLVTRSSHGGRLALTVRVAAGLAVATANDFASDLAHSHSPLTLGAPTDVVVTSSPLADQRVSLDSAPIVVGGGRGLDPESFVQLERIADALGGAVSASLPAVDLGLAPVGRQVGQSGKFVNPLVYFAAGMSGTPQHFAGVGGRARIIAVNSDRDAPIFGFAEVGAVADARDLLPLLADALEQKKESQA